MAGKKGRSGRKPMITPPIEDILIDAIKLGLSYKAAAKLAGIGEVTFHAWVKRGRENHRNTVYKKFVKRLDEALPTTGREYLDAIKDSVTTPIIIEKESTKTLPDGTQIHDKHRETRPADVKGAFWWLERRFPEEFGRRLEHSGSLDTGPRKITVELVKSGEKVEEEDA